MLLQINVPGQKCGHTQVTPFSLTARVVVATNSFKDLEFSTYTYTLEVPPRFSVGKFTDIERLELVCKHHQTLLSVHYKTDMWQKATVQLKVSEAYPVAGFLTPTKNEPGPYNFGWAR